MTKKQAAVHERILRGIGVYRPCVSTGDENRLFIESYPLTAVITPGFDREAGPLHNVKITDCSLSRIGEDPTITTFQVYIGQDLLGKVGQRLMDFHAPAYERAHQQDRESESRIASALATYVRQEVK